MHPMEHICTMLMLKIGVNFSDLGYRMAARAPGGTKNAVGRSKKSVFFRNGFKIGDSLHPQLPSVHVGIFCHFLPKKS